MSHAHQHSTDPAEILASHGLRTTGQRLTVLQAMLAEANDVTAQRLHERLRPSSPSLGLATVYRTLNALADAGVLDRLQHGSSGACFRYCDPGHHHHLRCRVCHTVVELRDCDLDGWAERVGKAHGFHDIQHSLELDGLCSNCED